ncbi:MAG: four helix bundle protein [bacterium]
MTKTNKPVIYDLEERTYQFAKNIAFFCKKLPRNISNIKYIDQLIRASGSVGANYIEANESLSRKDFVMRIKICRKESKEAAYWIRLITETNFEDLIEEGLLLKEEATQLKKIFCCIIEKSS